MSKIFSLDSSELLDLISPFLQVLDSLHFLVFAFRTELSLFLILSKICGTD